MTNVRNIVYILVLTVILYILAVVTVMLFMPFFSAVLVRNLLRALATRVLDLILDDLPVVVVVVVVSALGFFRVVVVVIVAFRAADFARVCVRVSFPAIVKAITTVSMVNVAKISRWAGRGAFPSVWCEDVVLFWVLRHRKPGCEGRQGNKAQEYQDLQRKKFKEML
jgi:hypothetical protein